jgi:hypothetical protein
MDLRSHLRAAVEPGRQFGAESPTSIGVLLGASYTRNEINEIGLARDVVAESVAYGVGSHFGLDMALRSAHYVASWLDAPETFKATMSAIHDGAATLIDSLDAAMSGEPLILAA